MLLALGAACMPGAAAGATIFFGPTTYGKVLDSPLPTAAAFSQYYVEDFESGALGAPGIGQVGLLPPPLASFGLGAVVGPNALTDSVDADDGVLDGIGRDGHSFRSGNVLTTPTSPPSYQFRIVFEFDKASLGALPSAFGFVWTDGPANSTLTLFMTLASGERQQGPLWQGLGDGAHDGSTSDDRFFGVLSETPFSRIDIVAGIFGGPLDVDFIEIDHVQYGLVVPEPLSCRTAWSFGALALAGRGAGRMKRG
jgi:hypothetical protein